MSKIKEKVHTLGKTQREIIKYLAEHGSQNIYSTNLKLFSYSHYHATHYAFKSLEEKGYIQKLENSKYWLTNKGIFTALSDENVKLRPLIKTIEKYKNKDLSMFKPIIEMLENTPILRSMFKPLFDSLPFQQLNHKLSEKEMETVYKTLKGSPLEEIFKAFLKLHEEIHKPEVSK